MYSSRVTKATEIGTVPMQHSGWSGFREVLISAAEKVIERGRQPVVGLLCEESLRELRRKRRLLDEKFSGFDEPWVLMRSRAGR